LSLIDNLLARFRKPPAELTQEQRDSAALMENKCPDCGARDLWDGPRGGAARNIACGSCLSEFNILMSVPPYLIERMGMLSVSRGATVYGFKIEDDAPWPNEDPRYPPDHPLSRESNAAARVSGMQLPKR
jgi:hypothetical protein